MPARDASLTFVTVVFRAEVMLLILQARSMARSLEPSTVTAIIVVDNGWRPLPSRWRRRIIRSYGPLAGRVRIVRTAEIVPHLPPTVGWRSQQIAKLLVARSVSTDHYVVLDAKNHLIRAASVADFIGDDGRAHGETHPYTSHTLRPRLESVMRYLGASSTQLDESVADFPPTATPFVMDTPVTLAMIDDLETTSGLPFAREFEAHELTEFFLYSGWLTVRGSGVDSAYDRVPIPSPTVWPKRRSVTGVELTIAEATESDSAFFAVHRTTLARGDRATRIRIAAFWTERGLFPNERAAMRHIAAFRRSYIPEMVAKKLAERLERRKAS